jgi:CheY-like chemotaxis protein
MAKLLIVEDQESIQTLLSTLLVFEGHQVEVAVEKDDILEVLDQGDVDLVLLDVHLESPDGKEISGYEILDIIRRSPGLKDTRVVMTSGMNFQSQALQAGADAFLAKPYLPEDLSKVINQALKAVD